MFGENLQQVLAAFRDTVRQQFETIDEHEHEQGVVPAFEVGLAVPEFDSRELALKETKARSGSPLVYRACCPKNRGHFSWLSLEERLPSGSLSDDSPHRSSTVCAPAFTGCKAVCNAVGSSTAH